MGKTELIITLVLFNLFFVGFIVAVWIYIRKYRDRKRDYLTELAIKNEIHQKELLTTQLEIQKETMEQIGRELHDNIGQKLTLVSLYTQQLIFENKSPEITEKISQVSEIINDSIGDLRSLSKSLTNNRINTKNIIELVQEEVDKANILQKCKISFQYDEQNEEMNFNSKNVILRIVQEGIQNSMKHAECSKIDIRFRKITENTIEITIKDNGKGFSTNDTSDGIGLVNMKKRVEMLNGNFKIESQPQQGTKITTQLKLKS